MGHGPSSSWPQSLTQAWTTRGLSGRRWFPLPPTERGLGAVGLVLAWSATGDRGRSFRKSQPPLSPRGSLALGHPRAPPRKRNEQEQSARGWQGPDTPPCPAGFTPGGAGLKFRPRGNPRPRRRACGACAAAIGALLLRAACSLAVSSGGRGGASPSCEPGGPLGLQPGMDGAEGRAGDWRPPSSHEGVGGPWGPRQPFLLPVSKTPPVASRGQRPPLALAL